MMLVRMDPSSSTINLLSVPRDLKVTIPEGGALVTNKLNAAYFYGGPGLLIKILQQQVFPGLKVNHVIDVGFGGFEKMIDAIGCVYTDVDHRYYNNTAVTDYSSIDLQVGYQKLCGADALSFVRFRHTDSDIVRNARQQDFIRWAKSQFTQDQIINDRNTLLKILGKNATTDHNLHTTDGLINLFDLAAFSSGGTVKQIPFPAVLLPCAPVAPTASSAVQQTPCYVGAASQQAEDAAFHAFMTPTHGQAAPAGAPATSSSAGGKPGGGGGGTAGLSANVSDGQGQAHALGKIGMPIYFPKLLKSGSNYCSDHTSLCPVEGGATGAAYPRAYLLHDRQGVAHYAYRMTLEINPILGQYYGVQGTTWLDPPILSTPTETKMVNGKKLLLYRQRRQAQPGGLAYPAGRVLDLEHADRQHPEPSAGRDRGVVHQGSLAANSYPPGDGKVKRADRGDRHRIRRAGHRRWIRRARQRGLVRRYRCREDRAARAGRDTDL